MLITNGLPVTYRPGPEVLANGFFIGSDAAGLSQAHGMFDDLSTYDHEISGETISNAFGYESIWFYGNPMNMANIASAPSSPTLTPYFNVVTGTGNLIELSNTVPCLTNSRVWLTNLIAAPAASSTMNVTFTIAGGADATLYDVFANSILDFSTNRTVAWAWMGQGQHCRAYLITNLPSSGTFLVLGIPLDSDLDGLTDAYEALVSKTNPQVWDTDGDGSGDGAEVLLGTDPLSYDFPSPLALPSVGSSYLRILAPDLLEMVRITSDTSAWNFVTNGVLTAPSSNQFQVKSGGSSVGVTEVGFKRRALHAALTQYDLRIESILYLRLASTNWAGSNATIEVTTTNTALWPVTNRFVCVNNPLRYSPAIHVNQVGYSPNYPKKAMLGYYLGSLGEMQISTNLGFKLVLATTGSQVYPTFGLANLTARPDDHNTWPSPGGVNEPLYQRVLEADFSNFTNSGNYQLVIPGLGASYPFRIEQGTMMDLARTYALGLYHQRCGKGPGGLLVNDPQFTRFTHTNCHTAQAQVPLPQTNTLFTNTWSKLAEYGAQTYVNPETDNNAPQIASPLTNSVSVLFPYPTSTNSVPTLGGHHDAGDYSKYTINSALFVHFLTFAADNLGLTNVDNLGLPESSDGIPDILQEVKWEADFLVNMQDSNDGGFYFLVYPRDTEYENQELPGPHDQVVWPKTTSATAAAVAALAEIGSSPAFNSVAIYRSTATNYLKAATNGWKFLTNAIAQRGKDGCYQRITHYGDRFTHDDELAWAAASLFAATGDRTFFTNLHGWFPNPGDTNGHNGFDFQWIKTSGGSLPSSGNSLAAIKYIPITNTFIITNGQTIYTNISGRMQFRIFDSEGTMVVDKYDTNISVYASNKIAGFKIYLNGQYDDPKPGYPGTLDSIAAIVGQCHKTWVDGWRRMSEGYGCAIRSYAFAARSGRRLGSELDSNYLFQCESEITNGAAQLRLWSSQNAYGTGLSPDEKGFYSSQYGVAYYFGGDRAFDLAVAERVQSDTNNVAAIVENFNYEAGRNPLNVSFVTGLGWSRQREIVDQYAWNNPAAVLPPSGKPVGNISDALKPPGGFPYQNLQTYAFPGYGNGANFFPLYDRWADAYNAIIEFVHLQMARSLAAAGAFARLSPLTNQVWRNASATIVFPNGFPAFSTKCVAQLSTTQDLAGAQIVWDPGSAPWNFFGQNPVSGTNYTFIPAGVGEGRTLQAEAVLPDGRRVFASTNFSVWDPIKGGTNFVSDTNTIALYHFDTNLVTDSSGNGYALTLHGSVSRTNSNANWMRTPTGAVARFRGADDYLEVITIPDSAILPSGAAPLTIEAWIYPRAWKTDSGGNAQFIVSLKQDSDTQWALYYTPQQTPNAPQLFASCCAMLSNTDLNTLLSLSTWHQLTIRLGTDGVTSAYIDGVLRATSANAPNYDRTSNWTLTLGHFDGDIDEVRISNVIRP